MNGNQTGLLHDPFADRPPSPIATADVTQRPLLDWVIEDLQRILAILRDSNTITLSLHQRVFGDAQALEDPNKRPEPQTVRESIGLLLGDVGGQALVVRRRIEMLATRL